MAEKKTTTKKTSVKKVAPKKEPVTKDAAEKVVQKVQDKKKTLEATIYSQTGTSAGTVSLPESIFAVKWNNDLVHQVVTGMLANKRTSTAHAKDRSEVSGGGKKPWKQKGTGRARHGSSRSPIWVGGGVTHGPRNEKDYSKKINRKMRAKALFSVLSKKFSDGHVLFVESLSIGAPKTKDAAAILSSLAGVKGFESLTSKKKTAALIALPEITEAIKKSFSNIPGATVIATAELSALSALNASRLVIIDPKKALELFEKKTVSGK
ncbi:MAG TPA: 50S ribosomal protein L4 [Candidatus Paceibacterota bacterium]|nr:50S ribosomal protein L4 [Candidatus Paceibacterota bacterium]